MKLQGLAGTVRPAGRLGGVRASGWFIRRTLYHMRNNIFGLVIETVLSPVVMLLIFTFLFGGAIAGSVEDYIQYLLPGIVVLTVVPMTVYTGSSLCTDIAKGVYDRFRTMAFWQPAAIVGSILAESLRYLAAIAVVILAGSVLGFRAEGGSAGLAAGLLYVYFFTICVSWIFALIGNVVKRPETVSGTSMMIVYPFLFASSVLVDPTTMPDWLQTLINWNPVSIAVNLTRELMQGTAHSTDLFLGIGVAIGIAAVFVPLTIYAYMKRE